MPIEPGVLSALGMLLSDVKYTGVATRLMDTATVTAASLEPIYEALERDLRRELGGEGMDPDAIRFERSCDMRYRGQAYEINVPVPEVAAHAMVAAMTGAFHARHRSLYGQAAEGDPVEFVNYRVTGIGAIRRPELKPREGGPGRALPKGVRRACFPGAGWVETPVFGRADLAPGTGLSGPALVEEPGATAVVFPGHRLEVDPLGNMTIRVHPRGGEEGPGMSRVDPVSIEVVGNYLVSAVREMNSTLRRTAYSTILRESMDSSTALFDPAGQMIGQADHVPSHQGSLARAARMIAEDIALDPEDIVILNHPYEGGTHHPDIMIFKPVFHEGHLVAIAAALGHHIDVGGRSPGSISTDARDVFEEGLMIPPLKLYRRGELVPEILRMIEANIRVPEKTLGDIRAEIGAVTVGERRYLELVERYGRDELAGIVAAVLDHSEALMREDLARLPDGSYSAEGFMDSDGIADEPVRIFVTVTLKDGSAVVDFTGTDRQLKGPFNCSHSSVYSAVYAGIRYMTNPIIRQNEGCFRPIEIVRPEGTVVNPVKPAPISGRFTTLERIADTIVQALNQARGEDQAGSGLACVCSFAANGTYPDSDRRFVCFENLRRRVGRHHEGRRPVGVVRPDGELLRHPDRGGGAGVSAARRELQPGDRQRRTGPKPRRPGSLPAHAVPARRGLLHQSVGDLEVPAEGGPGRHARSAFEAATRPGRRHGGGAAVEDHQRLDPCGRSHLDVRAGRRRLRRSPGPGARAGARRPARREDRRGRLPRCLRRGGGRRSRGPRRDRGPPRGAPGRRLAGGACAPGPPCLRVATPGDGSQTGQERMAMQEGLRIGVIGLGAQGVQHMWGIGRIEGVRLAAVVDVDAERASRVAAEKGVPGFSDLDAFFRAGAEVVDGVVVCVPNPASLRDRAAGALRRPARAGGEADGGLARRVRPHDRRRGCRGAAPDGQPQPALLRAAPRGARPYRLGRHPPPPPLPHPAHLREHVRRLAGPCRSLRGRPAHRLRRAPASTPRASSWAR